MTILQAGNPLVPPPKGKWVRFDKNERIPDWVFPQGNETDCRFGTTVQVGWWEKLDGYAFVPIDCDPDGVISIPPGDRLWYNPDPKYREFWPESGKRLD